MEEHDRVSRHFTCADLSFPGHLCKFFTSCTAMDPKQRYISITPGSQPVAYSFNSHFVTLVISFCFLSPSRQLSTYLHFKYCFGHIPLSLTEHVTVPSYTSSVDAILEAQWSIVNHHHHDPVYRLCNNL